MAYFREEMTHEGLFLILHFKKKIFNAKRIKTTDIFERLRNGETVPTNDAQYFKLAEASYKTKKLLVQMNSASEPTEINHLFSRITDTKID